jgi:hypothetical protein
MVLHKNGSCLRTAICITLDFALTGWELKGIGAYLKSTKTLF